MNAIIIVPNPDDSSILAEKLKDFPFLNVSAVFSTYEDGIDYIHENLSDVVFIDLYSFDEATRFNFKELCSRLHFDFVVCSEKKTVCDKLCTRNCMSNVGKPINNSRLNIVMADLKKKDDEKQLRESADLKIKEAIDLHLLYGRIKVYCEGKTVYVLARNISYCKSIPGGITDFYLISGLKIRSIRPFAVHEEELYTYFFVRIHNQYIINPKHIHEAIKKGKKRIIMKFCSEIKDKIKTIYFKEILVNRAFNEQSKHLF